MQNVYFNVQVFGRLHRKNSRSDMKPTKGPVIKYGRRGGDGGKS